MVQFVNLFRSKSKRHIAVQLLPELEPSQFSLVVGMPVAPVKRLEVSHGQASYTYQFRVCRWVGSA